MARPTGIIRNETEREQHREEVARLHAMGLTKMEISKRLGVSHVTVGKDVEVIQKRYREAQVRHAGALVAEKLELLRAVRREAFAAWERSKEDAQRTSTKKVRIPFDDEKKGGRRVNGRKPKDGPRLSDLRAMFVAEMTEVVEGRLPASEYMNIVLKTVEQERALLGLDRPAKSEVDMTVQTVSWDALFAQAVVRGNPAEHIEAEIVRVDPGLKPLPAATPDPVPNTSADGYLS